MKVPADFADFRRFYEGSGEERKLPHGLDFAAQNLESGAWKQ